MSYVTDPIGDFLTRIRNAQMAGRNSCSAPWSRLKEELAKVLKDQSLVAHYEIQGEAPKQNLVVTFAKDKMKLQLQRMSKPGRRLYAGASELKPVLHGYGIAIITTSQGLMTDKEARRKKIGGEVLCTIS